MSLIQQVQVDAQKTEQKRLEKLKESIKAEQEFALTATIHPSEKDERPVDTDDYDELVVGLEFVKLPQYSNEEWEQVLQEEKEEPMLVESDNRYILHQDKNGDAVIPYPVLYELFERIVKSQWTLAEILRADISIDKRQFLKLTPGERNYFKYVLSFFGPADGLVSEGIITQLYQRIQVCEARLFYGQQMGMESIHAQTYSFLIQGILSDRLERTMALAAVKDIRVIRWKANWIKKWINCERRRASEMIAAFVAIEGMFFAGSFASIFWLRETGRMPTLCVANEAISRDETLHTDFGITMYNHLRYRLPFSTVQLIFRDATRMEKMFVNDAMSIEFHGLNKKGLYSHIEFLANFLVRRLGYHDDPLLYPESTKPLPYAFKAQSNGTTNFFERVVMDYQKQDLDDGEEFGY